MSDIERQQRDMLLRVARALPPDLLERMPFVGGSTTALLLNDPIARQGIRYTLDVDLIVGTDGRGHWARIQDRLRQCGFRESPEDDIICRMRLDELIVDFMPTDASILGFTNRWYRRALETSQPYRLDHDLCINLLDPVYFVATKLDAFKGRGNDDPLRSHDLEDILTLVDGRKALGDEIAAADQDVSTSIAQEFACLLRHPDFDYAIAGNITDPGRADIVWERWRRIAQENEHDRP
ncbi:hypothetical protein [Thiorhodococcus minor]|uniref:Nucleotidyl transferase AbiEii/AbiGii toxin family protein n=1 Tax=Thiorhodococcus minor TaxID=57489 RepID=A0A6M0K0T5_9GAMM|nr:hypothetical protein [Thiorhodococcus minor]NEV63386.1 hypothetical protein [Thiorhodococcus minor]